MSAVAFSQEMGNKKQIILSFVKYPVQKEYMPEKYQNDIKNKERRSEY